MSKSDFLNLRQNIEQHLRSQSFDAARSALQGVVIEQVPSSMIAEFAALARRADQPVLALKLLWPELVDKRGGNEAMVFELASTLRKMGLTQQAKQWLSRLPFSRRRWQEQAFMHMHRWEYLEARENLEQALATDRSDDSNDQVLKVNLAACLIYLEDAENALGILAEIESELRLHHHQLYLNALELKGQALLLSGRTKEAIEVLQSALTLQNSEQGLTGLFLRKWLLIANLRSGTLTLESAELSEFRAAARRVGHWETVRDLDYQVGLLSSDPDLRVKVLFGTPFPSFKARVQKSLGGTIPSRYHWKDPRSTAPTKEFDAFTLVDPNLVYGQTLHRLCLLLLSDHYRPFAVNRVFDLLFPDELFNPYSSEKRVHNLVAGLRESFKKLGLDAELDTSVAGYRLRPGNHVSYWVRQQMSFSSADALFAAALKELISYPQFSRQQAERCLPLSSDRWQRQLKQLVDSGYAEAIGEGKARRYKIVSG